MSAKRKAKRKFQKSLETPLRVEVWALPTLLQRVEDAMAKGGTSSSRSALVCALLDEWAAARGC